MPPARFDAKQSLCMSLVARDALRTRTAMSCRRAAEAVWCVLALTAGPAQAQTPAVAGAPPLNPTQEIARETPEGPALVAGPTEIRIGGYLGVTGIYRSTNSGGTSATSFGTIPYGDSTEGSLSEMRLSAQSSRLSIRVNAAPAEHRASLAGYFEMDFNGTTPGNVAVTSTSVGFRLRNAFGEAHFDRRFIIAAGQAYTLMTPAKDQLSIWPSDYEVTHAVDMNYVAGMVWGRLPQVRFTYRPTSAFNWALSVENPEQQLGSGVVALPSCCATDLADQYNTGNNGLAVPNLMPDIVSRVAYNAGKTFHLDAGGVLRVFRHTLKPDGNSVKQAGGGGSVNGRVTLGAGANVFGQFAYGAGLGRYIGGLVPDVTISADGRHSSDSSVFVGGGFRGTAFDARVHRLLRQRRERGRQLLDRHRRHLYRLRLSGRPQGQQQEHRRGDWSVRLAALEDRGARVDAVDDAGLLADADALVSWSRAFLRCRNALLYPASV